jgi:uncharacterized 2Fe-2S/4Fe-4S cluster protein (DUF4445 family)
MDVYLSGEQKMKVSESYTQCKHPNGQQTACHSERSEESYRTTTASLKCGVAIDIGTTTVVTHLLDIETGECLATANGANAQRIFGADVISRIQYSVENGHEALTRLIREQLASLIKKTCVAAEIDTNNIKSVTIAANTVMQHLAAGYPPDSMGTVPFTPFSLFGEELPVWEDLPVAKETCVYYTPAISAYVGGDITAGILAAGLEGSSGPAIYLDIGTNGEIVMKCDGIYYCCATAAGPALEGAEITMGMAAVNGAIDHVKWNKELELSVIGNETILDEENGTPSGLCGSGLIDALAVLLETGAVDETGRLLGANEIEHEIAAYIDKVNDENVFWLNKSKKGIYITARDIRRLQLAVAAISAGIQTLLKHVGITEEQVESFLLAGGFGSFMDMNSAARIGLFPRSFLRAAKALGNTAGQGAMIILRSENARKTLEHIREHCEYIELSTSPVFNEQFVEKMLFPSMPNYKKLAALAEKCGFTHMAPLDISTLEFLQEVRDMCNAKLCDKYGTSWSCPPACVSLEEMRERVKGYSCGILVQTVGDIEDSYDWEGIMTVGERQKKNFALMWDELERGGEEVLAMGSGACKLCEACTYPDEVCRFPDRMEVSMEAYGLLVSKVCASNNLAYNYGADKIAFTACFLAR